VDSDCTQALVAFDPTAGRDMRAYSDGTTPGLKVGTGLDIGWAPAVVTHALSAEGHDASEDGTGRGTPLVAIPISADALRGEGSAKTPSADAEGRVRLRDPGLGIGQPGDPADTLAAAGPGAVAVTEPFTLANRGRGDSHQLEFRNDGTANAILTPNGGRGGIGVGAVAFHEDQRTGAVYETGHTHALAQPGGKPGQGYAAIREGSAVRRLTPVECERLQGFPDGWTCLCQPLEAYAADADGAALRCTCPDSPRYRALGNAVTVNVIEQLGRRLMEAL